MKAGVSCATKVRCCQRFNASITPVTVHDYQRIVTRVFLPADEAAVLESLQYR
jgi:hypothetical protein